MGYNMSSEHIDILDHEWYDGVIMETPVKQCLKCQCVLGSEMSEAPCGDVWGSKLYRKASIMDGKHSWQIFYKGRLVREVYAKVV